MSLVHAAIFIMKLPEENELQDKLRRCKTNEEREAAAKSSGYDFTTEELNEVIRDAFVLIEGYEDSPPGPVFLLESIWPEYERASI